MNRILIITVIVVLTITIIGSSSLTNVQAKGKVTRGSIDCRQIENDNKVTCCQTETGTDGIEITYCTVCDSTNPPSNCSSRMQVQTLSPDMHTSPKGDSNLHQPNLSPSESNEETPQNNGINPQQALTASRSN